MYISDGPILQHELLVCFEIRKIGNEYSIRLLKQNEIEHKQELQLSYSKVELIRYLYNAFKLYENSFSLISN